MKWKVDVNAITVQKDNFKTRDGKNFGEGGFWESDDQMANVDHFKRIVVECDVSAGAEEGSLTLIANLRSDTVRVVATQAPFTAQEFVNDLNQVLHRFARPVQRRKPGPKETVLVYAGSSKGPEVMTFVTEDALRFAAIMHDLREDGGFEIEVAA